MPTDYETLVPTEVVAQVVQELQTLSATVQLGNVIPIPTGVASVTILPQRPQAGFVSPTYGGRKPASEVIWTAARLVAEEIAVVISVPDAYIDDANFPIWDSIRPALSAAGRCPISWATPLSG